MTHQLIEVKSPLFQYGFGKAYVKLNFADGFNADI